MSDKLSKGKRLGQGAYGIVYKANDKEGRALAVKRLLIDETNTNIGSLREADMVSRFRHPHLVNTEVKYGTVFEGPLSPVEQKSVKDDSIAFVMERADGDAHDYFKKDRSLIEIKTLAVHVLLALEYMHAKGATHQDIKPQNVLYFNNNNLITFKVSDLGLAYWNSKYGYQSSTASTSWYRAPEIAYNTLHKNRYNHMVDMWSVGCMLYELIFGYPLLQYITEDNDHAIIKAYLELVPGCGGNITWDQFWSKSTKFTYFNTSIADLYNLRSLMQGLLAYHPAQRFSATTALNHPFFNEFQDYIISVRNNFKPTLDAGPLITTTSCAERQFGIIAASSILSTKSQELSQENYRPLFHTMMLFDKALTHNIRSQKPKYSKITENNGFHWSFDGTVVRFMVCYYIVYKYFGLLKPSIGWKDLLTEKYCSPNFLILARDFERYVVADVCRFQIYQHTPLDIAGLLDIELSERDIFDLYTYYVGNIWTNTNSELILESFLRHRTKPIVKCK